MSILISVFGKLCGTSSLCLYIFAKNVFTGVTTVIALTTLDFLRNKYKSQKLSLLNVSSMSIY